MFRGKCRPTPFGASCPVGGVCALGALGPCSGPNGDAVKSKYYKCRAMRLGASFLATVAGVWTCFDQWGILPVFHGLQ